jgi:hypothetical protein
MDSVVELFNALEKLIGPLALEVGFEKWMNKDYAAERSITPISRNNSDYILETIDHERPRIYENAPQQTSESNHIRVYSDMAYRSERTMNHASGLEFRNLVGQHVSEPIACATPPNFGIPNSDSKIESEVGFIQDPPPKLPMEWDEDMLEYHIVLPKKQPKNLLCMHCKKEVNMLDNHSEYHKACKSNYAYRGYTYEWLQSCFIYSSNVENGCNFVDS